MAGPIKISVLADVGQAVKNVTHFSGIVDSETKRVVTSLGDSKLSGSWGKFQEGFDVGEQRVQGFNDTITGVQDTMTGFQGMLGNRQPGQSFTDSMLQTGQGVADLASGVANFIGPMGAMLSGLKGMGIAAKISAGGQWLLNAAMSANPVMIVVLAIIALVVIVIIAYKKSETFRGIVKALGDAFMTAVRAVGQFVSGALSKLAELPGKIKAIFGKAKDLLVGVGKDIVGGLRDGIAAGWHWVTDKLHDLVSVIPGPVRKLLGINSPSRVFRQIGTHIGEGLSLGITDQADAVHRATEQLVSIPAGTDLAVSSVAGTAAGGGGGQLVVTFAASGDPVMDAIFEEFRKRIRVKGGNVQTVLGR